MIRHYLSATKVHELEREARIARLNGRPLCEVTPDDLEALLHAYVELAGIIMGGDLCNPAEVPERARLARVAPIKLRTRGLR